MNRVLSALLVIVVVIIAGNELKKPSRNEALQEAIKQNPPLTLSNPVEKAGELESAEERLFVLNVTIHNPVTGSAQTFTYQGEIESVLTIVEIEAELAIDEAKTLEGSFQDRAIGMTNAEQLEVAMLYTAAAVQYTIAAIACTQYGNMHGSNEELQRRFRLYKEKVDTLTEKVNALLEASKRSPEFRA